MTREDRHAEFILSLHGWKMRTYSDGGPALKRSDRQARKAAKLARRRNRRRK